MFGQSFETASGGNQLGDPCGGGVGGAVHARKIPK
jgi:hypothetical protein